MSRFSLAASGMLVMWEDGHVSGFPARAVVEVETALRMQDGPVAGTPTGPWYPVESAEGAYLVLRALFPDAEAIGAPEIPQQDDELAD